MRSIKRTRRLGLLALCAALVWATTLAGGASAAQASFAPDLELALSPARAAATPALALAIAQPARDSALARFTLSFQRGFEPTGAPGAASCAPAAFAVRGCAPASRIGTVRALAGGRLAFGGTLNKLSADRFALFLSGLGGAISQAVPGSLSRRRDGGLDLKLDRLPALALTAIVIRLDGGARSLVRNPARCGLYALDGKFTSRAGELALERVALRISAPYRGGC